MSELREHTILTLLRAWHWARDHKGEYGADGVRGYPAYVVCLEAQTVIEQEMKRRDPRAWSRWIHAEILDSCNPDKYFFPPEEARHD